VLASIFRVEKLTRTSSAFQAVASSSTRRLHTSPVTQAAKQASSVVRKQNILQQAKRAKDALSDRPSVVLGTRPSEEASKWPTCKLAKVLVDEEALARGEHIQPVRLPISSEALAMPTQLAFGVGDAEKDLLFNTLPEVSAEVNVLSPEAMGAAVKKGGVVEHQRRAELASQVEALKAFNFSRVIDLRNTNAGGIAFENRRRIVLAFSTPENPYDTGRAEVQGASRFDFSCRFRLLIGTW
jgi:small subunit ribosomal protein S15